METELRTTGHQVKYAMVSTAFEDREREAFSYFRHESQVDCAAEEAIVAGGNQRLELNQRGKNETMTISKCREEVRNEQK